MARTPPRLLSLPGGVAGLLTAAGDPESSTMGETGGRRLNSWIHARSIRLYGASDPTTLCIGEELLDSPFEAFGFAAFSASFATTITVAAVAALICAYKSAVARQELVLSLQSSSVDFTSASALRQGISGEVAPSQMGYELHASCIDADSVVTARSLSAGCYTASAPLRHCTSTKIGSLKWYKFIDPPTDSREVGHRDGPGDVSFSLPPALRGYVERLPSELIARIARMLSVSTTRRDVVYMKLACRSWSKAFETGGPLLVFSKMLHALEAGPILSILKIVQRPYAPLTLESVDCLYPPPSGSWCWGAAEGLLALKDAQGSNMLLHCPTCGFVSKMPHLPQNHLPRAVFLRTPHFVLSIMIRLDQPSNSPFIDMSYLYIRQLGYDDHIGDAELDADQIGNAELDDGMAFTWSWEPYPGSEELYPMRSVNFIPHMAGVTAFNKLTFERPERATHQPMRTSNLNLNLDPEMVTWNRNGQHIFLCGETPFLCVLLRSYLNPVIVRIKCFRIEVDEAFDFEHYQPRETTSFGAYTVYLGSNQPVVLTATGSPGREPNTVYIEDNDGQVRSGQLLAINVDTQEVRSIPIPHGVIQDQDYTASAWVCPPGERCHLW